MFYHHLRHNRYADASRDHVRNGRELATGQRDLRTEATRLEQMVHLLRQAMHLVEKEKPL